VKKNRIEFTAGAERDLVQLLEFIEEHDSAQRALYVMERLEALISTLTEDPDRGAVVRELSALGLREYRQVIWKPRLTCRLLGETYRVIYQLRSSTVYILLIVDGRRDLQTLLQQRLLG
jgi:toxin ParE1/3/4